VPARSFWPLILVFFVLAALAVAIGALPASMVMHFLPAAVHAEDFSGSVWHGSAGKITAMGRDAGALEWRLHPAALLRLRIAAELHWVKGGFALDGSANADRGGIEVRNLEGGGRIEDLRDLGVAQGWHGIATVNVKELKAFFSGSTASFQSAVGDIAVEDLAAPQVAAGTDLGGYSLHFADAALSPNSEATAELVDTGGPLAVNAEIHFFAKERRGMLSGTVKERPDAPAALRSQLADLAQLHSRDAEGRIPIDLEFTL
jgi:Type II secretion system (T2SS), protein N